VTPNLNILCFLLLFKVEDSSLPPFRVCYHLEILRIVILF
jgi:hypothetical protein